MIEGAGEVFVIYDPEETFDAMHAGLFTRSFVNKLPCRNLGGEIEGALTQLNVLPEMIAAAQEERLTPETFWKLYRARRNHPPYLRRLLARLDSEERPLLAALLCRNIAGRMSAPAFERRLADLIDALRSQGIDLPDTRVAPATAG
jgi:hypothetical protein